MTLVGRLARIQAAAERVRVERRQAKWDEFEAWVAANFSEAENGFWDRWILNAPTDETFFEKLSMSPAEAESILVDYPPLTAEEDAALTAAVHRVPDDLRLEFFADA